MENERYDLREFIRVYFPSWSISKLASAVHISERYFHDYDQGRPLTEKMLRKITVLIEYIEEKGYVYKRAAWSWLYTSMNFYDGLSMIEDALKRWDADPDDNVFRKRLAE